MALSARPVGVPSGPNVSSAHMPAGGRNVASATYGPVDEISPKAEVFADPNYNFQGFTDWGQSQHPEITPPPKNPTTNFSTPSTTFLSLLTQHQNDIDPTVHGSNAKGPGYQQILGKAVAAYESTAYVISNPPQTLGGSYSATL